MNCAHGNLLPSRIKDLAHQDSPGYPIFRGWSGPAAEPRYQRVRCQGNCSPLGSLSSKHCMRSDCAFPLFWGAVRTPFQTPRAAEGGKGVISRFLFVVAGGGAETEVPSRTPNP